MKENKISYEYKQCFGFRGKHNEEEGRKSERIL